MLRAKKQTDLGLCVAWGAQVSTLGFITFNERQGDLHSEKRALYRQTFILKSELLRMLFMKHRDDFLPKETEGVAGFSIIHRETGLLTTGCYALKTSKAPKIVSICKIFS